MQLYNTLTRRKEELKPLKTDGVRLYTCGPTVYHYAHIGNLRTYIFEDLLRRTLEFVGFPVKHVMNITDVGHLTSDADAGEDKMQKGAKREGKTVWEVADFYTKAFMADITRLNIVHPTVICKATDHISEMIAQIQQLEKNGLTYISGGNVYFDATKFKHYGELAQLDKQDLKAGARIDVDANKKSPYDFVLWFTVSKHGNQDMQWDSPWGRGFPGWHIECSAMSSKYLGDQFDIHCGGIDHIPVHHTNEIAQAEGAGSPHPWVKIWMHGNFLTMTEGAKMAKSGDNFLTVQTLIDEKIDPLDYRYFCLQAHYRKELSFSWDALNASKNALRKLRAKMFSFPKKGKENTAYLEAFTQAMEDDLNAPQALSIVWKLIDDEKISDGDKWTTLIKCDKVLGLRLDEEIQVEIPQEVLTLQLQRDEARKNKDFKTSDTLRAAIEAKGFTVKDLPGGSTLIPQ
jgi:cysteinyl-tRNA synthetase